MMKQLQRQNNGSENDNDDSQNKVKEGGNTE
jgi:hypothetical protein